MKAPRGVGPRARSVNGGAQSILEKTREGFLPSTSNLLTQSAYSLQPAVTRAAATEAGAAAPTYRQREWVSGAAINSPQQAATAHSLLATAPAASHSLDPHTVRHTFCSPAHSLFVHVLLPYLPCCQQQLVSRADCIPGNSPGSLRFGTTAEAVVVAGQRQYQQQSQQRKE